MWSSPEYRDKQPFGQVPYLDEDGRPTLFESGAIVLDVAIRAGKLLPKQDGERSAVISWLFAALNSVEPSLMNAAEVEYFSDDPADALHGWPDLVRQHVPGCGRQHLRGHGPRVGSAVHRFAPTQRLGAECPPPVPVCNPYWLSLLRCWWARDWR
jgi:hypothetical protein